MAKLEVLLTHSEASALADMHGTINDLRATERICALWIAEVKKGRGQNFEAVSAFCAAALVRYGRTVGTGVREGVPQAVIASLPPHLRELHSFFRNARDKWVAHSVNSFELNHVIAVLISPEDGERGLADIRTHSSGVAALTAEQAADLKNLASEILTKMEVLYNAERQRLLSFARSLPADLLYSLPSERSRPGGNPGKQRKRFGE